MRKTLGLILVLFTIPATAAEEFAGCFDKNNDEIAQITRFWPVYTKTEKGREKVQELRDQNFICENKPNSWVLCRKIIDKNTLSISDIQTRLPEVSPYLCFGVLKSKTLMTEADSLDVWEYKQYVSAQSWEAIEFELWDLHTTNFKKLKVEDTNEDTHWINFYPDSQQMQRVQTIGYGLDEGYYRILVYRNYQYRE
ncbi:MAG: hypothetical protein HRT44_10980 [Bdellovibrionales bacterium]|nr:hypothetical protein [Bdellovibrionales bacterium]NQZ19764.1 hypothetical protein [Bdellovibrionales bacterium]